jgi:uncharacterized damage-inducible protein DinB
MAEQEVWLRGPVEGVAPSLIPVAQALIQAREDLQEIGPGILPGELWLRPGGAASVGFHLLHMAGALDRLFTYARGEPLSPAQLDAVRQETDLRPPLPEARALLAQVEEAIERALVQLRSTQESQAGEGRGVGRKKIPSTVRDLVNHGAQHLFRHVGQMTTTLKIIRGLGLKA